LIWDSRSAFWGSTIHLPGGIAMKTHQTEERVDERWIGATLSRRSLLKGSATLAAGAVAGMGLDGMAPAEQARAAVSAGSPRVLEDFPGGI
jgi:hypothetical protein